MESHRLPLPDINTTSRYREMGTNEIIEIIGAVIALGYLYFEYKASKWLWPMAVVMPIAYIWIFFRSKFYAGMGINIYYFFAAIYGWIKWTGRQSDGREPPIRRTPPRLIFPLTSIGILLFAAIAFLLSHYTDSPVSMADSLITALSIIGMWMLAHKHLEQWWVWIAVNILSCGIYFWRGLYPTSILYAIYSVISVMGYFKWRGLMQAQRDRLPTE